MEREKERYRECVDCGEIESVKIDRECAERYRVYV